MIKRIVRDQMFLQQKSEPATEADKQIIETYETPLVFSIGNKKSGKNIALMEYDYKAPKAVCKNRFK